MSTFMTSGACIEWGEGMMRLLRVRCTFIPYIYIYIISCSARGSRPEGYGRLVGIKRHLLLPSYNNNTTAPRDDNLIYYIVCLCI